MGMSVGGYAASRGADPKALRLAIEAGVIRRDTDGTIDPKQADQSWGVARRASRGAIHQDTDAGPRSAQAKVDLAAAKLRLLQRRHEELADRYVVRSEAIAQGTVEGAEGLEASIKRDGEDGRVLLRRIGQCLLGVGQPMSIEVFVEVPVARGARGLDRLGRLAERRIRGPGAPTRTAACRSPSASRASRTRSTLAAL